MSLNNFFSLNDKNKNNVLNKIIEKIKNNKTISDEVALHKAEEIVFKPKVLEKIKLNSLTDIGLRPSLRIFFNDEDELKLIGKYLNVNWNRLEVGNADFLIKILRILEK